MSETGEIKLAVQRAVDKLVQRFAPVSEIIGELRAVVTRLEKQEQGASVGGTVAETVADAPAISIEAGTTGADMETPEGDGERVDASHNDEVTVVKRKSARKQYRR